jgi:hypothetical protein
MRQASLKLLPSKKNRIKISILIALQIKNLDCPYYVLYSELNNNLFAYFDVKLNMTTEIRWGIRADETTNLPYISMLSSLKFNDKTGIFEGKKDYAPGRIDLLPLIEQHEQNTRNKSVLSDGYYIRLGYINPNPPNIEANTSDSDHQTAKAILVRRLNDEDRRFLISLNQAFNQPNWQANKDNLIAAVGKSKDNELVKLIISTNDKRIESLPFELTSFIKETLGGMRPLSLGFEPPTGGYLDLS